MFKHILISTDGSPLANKAAKAGIALAHALGAKVTAYCAQGAGYGVDTTDTAQKPQGKGGCCG
ncbi:MAG: universal stress protein [Prolixibacteraceae bacterium]|nr:universal stress protein [Burkholderiales bacterium]